MKKICLTLLSTLVICLGTLNSFGASYTIEEIGVGGVLINPGSSASGTFNLPAEGVNTTPGGPAYDPSSSEVVFAEAQFVLLELGKGPESITITLDNTFFASVNNFLTFAGLGGDVEVSLLADNSLDWKVTSASGSTFIPSVLISARLDFTTGPKTQAVPDGGSMMALLGLSVLGLGWASRRVRA